MIFFSSALFGRFLLYILYYIVLGNLIGFLELELFIFRSNQTQKRKTTKETLYLSRALTQDHGPSYRYGGMFFLKNF